MAENLEVITTVFPGGLITHFFACTLFDLRGNRLKFYMRPAHLETPLGMDCIPLDTQQTLLELDYRARWLAGAQVWGTS